MATLHSSNTQRRHGGKDEPEDLRQLRKEHGGSLATLKELFADWTEEDLLYAIQDANGDVELAILRISEGHASQWGEVKGKKKTPKPKIASEKQEFRTSNSQRGGFAGRGRGDGFRGGRGGATRGAPRALNGGDRSGRPFKADTTAASDNAWNSTADSKTNSFETTTAVDSVDAAPSWGAEPSTINDSSDTTEAWSTPAVTTTTTTNDSWGATPDAAVSTDSRGAASAASTADSWAAPVTAISSTDSWGAALPATSTPAASARKLNTATIPAGSKMSWAKIVKPEPAPKPTLAPTPAVAPAPAAAVNIPAPKPTVSEPVKVEEPTVEEVPEVAPAAAEEKAPEEPVPEPAVEEKIEENIEEKVEEKVKEKVEEKVEEKAEEEKTEEEKAEEPIAALEPAPTATLEPAPATPVGPPGLKPKVASQPRRLNQDAPVVMPSGSSALQSVGVKFGSFSLNDDAEISEPEIQPEQPSQPTQPEQPAQQPAAATQSATQPQQPSYARQPTGATGYQGATPSASGLSPAATNASYLKQDPAANYIGHHHPGMGLDAMGSPYGSYMPNPATQLGSFGMGPMASLPNDYAALYGNELQRAAMYYDPTSYGQIPVTAGNNYQSRDTKYSQDSSSTVSTSGASNTGSTQAQQTLQQQQQQQQAYPGMAGGMPYYPYYYMAPNQFPNAYQQSGYGQPFVNKNMYPMYQHQQQQQQQHSSKPGTASGSPYGNYSSTAGQGHHQYSQGGYEDMSGAGIHGMGGLNNDPYVKYGNPGMQNFLGNQQQPAAPTPNASNGKGSSGSNYSGTDLNAAAGSQPSGSSQMAGAASLQGQQPGNGAQTQQGYYQQQMFSNYQYPSHHQGYHPNQHQGQHQGSGRNQQQFWGSQN
ncbi:RNAPII degradation factor [Gamsiella multidivaricata]|nr:RNAPII degradation factor [Gamsiella multidivaricata]